MKRTISFMNGEGSLGHNTRTFIAANVDADRTKNNITLVHEDLKRYITNCLMIPLKSIMPSRNAKTGRLRIIMTRFQEASRRNFFMKSLCR